MTFALVGLAIGLGARYPRFGADASQVAGSYGGVMFMVQAVLFVIVMLGLIGWPASVYLLQQQRGRPMSVSQVSLMACCFGGAVTLSVAVWIASMRSGVRALLAMGD
jgi:hypothetical protein